MKTATSVRLTPADGRFRLCLMGAGRMGRTHLEAIRGSGRVAVAGVVEPLPETRSLVRDSGIAAFASL